MMQLECGGGRVALEEDNVVVGDVTDGAGDTARVLCT